MKKISAIIIVLSSLLMGGAKVYSQIDVGVQVQTAPPPVQMETPPPYPGDGYMWTPGYWAYGPNGYYWMPGVWALPARVGFLWTPGYWGFERGFYGWHTGYWGPRVGYYGGVYYGNGYNGVGFGGGRWEGGFFRYNTAVYRGNFAHAYEDRRYAGRGRFDRPGFNGEGGIRRYPNVNDRGAMRTEHVEATREQQAHWNSHAQNVNRGGGEHGGGRGGFGGGGEHGGGGGGGHRR